MLILKNVRYGRVLCTLAILGKAQINKKYLLRATLKKI